MRSGYKCNWCMHVNIDPRTNKHGSFRCAMCKTVLNTNTCDIGYRL